jgi:hypothetical protein
MRDAYENPKRRAVSFDRWVETESGRVQQVIVEDLRGWELWGPLPSTLALSARVLAAIEQVSLATAKQATLDDEHGSLAKTVRDIERDITPVNDWVREASSFFGEANLRRVLRAAKQESEAEIDGEGLTCVDGTRRVRISANGIVET